MASTAVKSSTNSGRCVRRDTIFLYCSLPAVETVHGRSWPPTWEDEIPVRPVARAPLSSVHLPSINAVCNMRAQKSAAQVDRVWERLPRVRCVRWPMHSGSKHCFRSIRGCFVSPVPLLHDAPLPTAYFVRIWLHTVL